MSPHPNFTLAEPFTARVSWGIDSGGGSMGGGAEGWGAWEGGELGRVGSMGGWGAWEGGEHGRVGAWEGGSMGGWVHEGGCMRVGA